MKVIIGDVVAATLWETKVHSKKNNLRIVLLLMDLPCPQWQDYVAQKWIGLETEQRERFISFQEIDGVFNYVRTLIT